jgi:hypothetical protein
VPTVVKTIGTGGGRDYSTLAGWAASLPANLVSDGNSYEGDCYNDSEFAGTTNLVNLTGHTTDATHTITLTTGAGQSFRDNAKIQTNALRYDQSNGVGIRESGGPYSTDTPIIVSDSNVFISNLQVKGHAYAFDTSNSASVTIDDCIFTSDATRAAAEMRSGAVVRNSLFYTTGNPSTTGVIDCQNGGPSFYFCTIVSASDAAGTPPANVHSLYSSLSFENCAFFGCAAVKSGTSTFSFTNCMTDVASPPSGVTGGKTFANQFENTTVANGDWREKAGADLQGAATSDSTNGGKDIAGTSRPQSGKWDIGCWELLSLGTALTVDLALPIELLTMQRGAPPGLVEYLASPRSDNVAALDTSASQRGKTGLTFSFSGSQRADTALPIELLLTRRLDPGLRLEWATILFRHSAWPVGFDGEVAMALGAPVELLTNASGELDVVTEWTASLLRDAAAPSETATGVAAELRLRAEWLGAVTTLISEDASLPIEWAVLARPMLVSLERLLASPGKRRILGKSGRVRQLGRP